MTREIAKSLSANDLGVNGSHQAGILVPKSPKILEFFPRLDGTIKNPRALLAFVDRSVDDTHLFAFIYYNNKRFGGTRDEYRLTGMTGYLRAIKATVGDQLHLSCSAEDTYSIWLARADQRDLVERSSSGILKLSSSWVSIPTKR